MATIQRNPPFRAEHLGSLLRPPELIRAREGWQRGDVSREELSSLERRYVVEAVRLQERIGLQVISDGEFPRWSWRDLLFDTADGFSAQREESDLKFRDATGKPFSGRPVPSVVGRLRRRESMTVDSFRHVSALTSRTVKVTFPSPSVTHIFRGDRMLADSPYRGDRKAYFADVAAIYREEIAELASAGCCYIQVDDPPMILLADEGVRRVIRERGEDPDELARQYVDMFNDAVGKRPVGVTLGVHLCRGNSEQGIGSAGYDAIAEIVFAGMNADTFFLEYDTARSGGFEPLKHVPKDRTVVLGLISTKVPALESMDDLRRRVDEAARYVDMNRLCLSPQCGFASNYNQQRFSIADQERKLAHVVQAAQEIWKDA